MADGTIVFHILAAALGGLAVGLERQWSGHASGPLARFGGIRTFTLLGALAGCAGWLSNNDNIAAGAVLLAGGAAVVVAAYAAAMRREVDATTEVAALVVLGAGFLAGADHMAVSSSVIAVTVLMLVEKSALHRLATRLNDDEMRAAARFAVMAVVVLPLLPNEAYGPFGGVRPRSLWAVVLLFTGISFAGYIARRLVGGTRGDPLAGLLGGLVSSTQVALAFSRASRAEPARALPLACGVIAASTVLFVRTMVAASVLQAGLARALLPYAVPAFVVGLAAAAVTLRRAPATVAPPPPSNPLQLRAALQMALVFQLVIFLVGALRTRIGEAGVVLTGAVVGLTDVDAATLSMAHAVGEGLTPATGARAVAAGMLANTLLKLAIAGIAGRGRYRLAAAAGLTAICLALVAVLAVGA